MHIKPQRPHDQNNCREETQTQHQVNLEKRIGNYILTDMIGKGASAHVFTAEHSLISGKKVAIKVIHPENDSEEEDVLERFKRECKLLARLDKTRHSVLLPTLDAGIWNGSPYLVMPYVNGSDLKDVSRGMDPLLSLWVCAEIASALDHLHKLDIIHRDIKPANIRLTKDFGVKLLDTGIAKHLFGKGGHITTRDMGLGTVVYVSPEQFSNARDADARSDLYSLGKVLYELLTQQPLPRFKNIHDASKKIPLFQPRTPNRHEKVYAAAYPLIANMTQANPAKRDLDAFEVAARLNQIIAEHEQISELLIDPTHLSMTPHSMSNEYKGIERSPFCLVPPIHYPCVNPNAAVNPQRYHNVPTHTSLNHILCAPLRHRPTRMYFVGRAQGVDIHLDFPGISRTHALLYTTGSDETGIEFGIKDTASRNGIKLNGKQVQSQQLKEGDIITFDTKEGVHLVFSRIFYSKAVAYRLDDPTQKDIYARTP